MVRATITPPVSEGDAPEGGLDTQTVARITALETETKHTRSLVNAVSDTNKFVLVVLFIGYLGLATAAIFAIITAINNDSSSREELTKQVQLLDLQLQKSK